MHYSLSNALGRPYNVFLDADARAYIAAIETAGASVSSTQKAAISDFVVAEKAASRWTGLKRFHLPVWGVAAANAICMKSLASGTFNGSVTHAAGYVQGDGSTGFFDIGESPSSLSLSINSMSLFVLHRDAGASLRRPIGCNEATSVNACRIVVTTNIQTIIGTTAAATLAGTRDGIIIGTRTTSASCQTHKRMASGFTSGTEETTPTTGAIPNVNIYALANNNNGSAANFTNNQTGVWGLGDAVSDPSAFTLNIKTLWETVTGLTLP